MTLEQIGAAAKKAAAAMNRLTVVQKNEGLSLASEELVRCADEILQANAMDLEQARQAGMKESLLDRLTLTRERIQAMAEGLRQVVGLTDSVGETISMKVLPNGLQVGQA